MVDLALAEIVALFAGGRLQSFVMLPGESGRRTLSDRAWRDAFFPERMFLAETIEIGHGPEFEAAINRTPFVEIKDVDACFREREPSRRESRAALALRELLLGLAMDGVLSPDEAEGFATAWGLGGFSFSPAKDEHDPLKLATWTLAMSITWIMSRSLRRVREAMDSYRAKCWRWSGFARRLPIEGGSSWHEVHGNELATLEPLSASTIALHEALNVAEDRGQLAIMTAKDAREDLWLKLSEGTIVAAAVSAGDGVVRVPAHEWPYIELQTDARLRDRLVFRNGDHRPAYSDVTLPRADLMATWPSGGDGEPLFNLGTDHWSLLEAALWVGCQGKRLGSDQVASEALDDKGAIVLFNALFRQPGLVATGLTSSFVREPIPREYWEMATTDPNLFRKRHYVSFIDDQLNRYGGQFTPVGQDNVRWFGIEIQRDSLFAAFPQWADTEIPAGPPGESPRRESRKLAAARKAIEAVFPDGIPAGLSDKERLDQVNAWLRANQHSPVSLATLNRARLPR